MWLRDTPRDLTPRSISAIMSTFRTATRIRSSAYSRPVLLALLVWISLSQVNASCTDILLQSGYPACFNQCASTCEKYCPGALVSDPSCACKTPAYTKDIFSCGLNSCDSDDYQKTVALAKSDCELYGIDISSQLLAVNSSTSGTPSAETSSAGRFGQITATAGVGTGPNSGIRGIPITTIAGLAVGVLAGIGIGALLVWLCLRKRKPKVNPAQTHGPVITGPPFQGTDTTGQKEPFAKWNPQSPRRQLSYGGEQFTSTAISNPLPFPTAANADTAPAKLQFCQPSTASIQFFWSSTASSDALPYS